MAKTSSDNRFRKQLGFPLKITLIITLILAFGVGVNLFLNYINFSNSYRQLVQSQFAVVSNDLKLSIESGLNLGLELSELRNVQQLLGEVPHAHPEITTIKVVAPDGTILFDANPALIGQAVAAIWSDAARSAKGGNWQTETGAELAQGLTLFNSFQQPVGTLIIGFPASLVNDVTSQVFHSLLEDFFLLITAAFLLTALLVRLNARGLLLSLKRMSSSLAAVEDQSPAPLDHDTAANALEQDFVAFQDTVSQVQARLQQLHLALAAAPQTEQVAAPNALSASPSAPESAS